VARARAGPEVDVVLSSGFLSFASHCGFLDAVEGAGLAAAGVCGTSAGALTGALWATGRSVDECAAELDRVAPAQLVEIHGRPWEGLLSLRPTVKRLREVLPERFEDLERPFACGVLGPDGRYALLREGPGLAEAVAASASIPFLFTPTDFPGLGPCRDGGKADRVGLVPWRDLRRREAGAGGGEAVRPALVHVIQRSSPFSGDDAVFAGASGREPRIAVVRSPKAGVSLLDLGDFAGQRAAARVRAGPAARWVAERLAETSGKSS